MRFKIKLQELLPVLNKAENIAARDSIRDASDCFHFQVVMEDEKSTLNVASTDNLIYFKATNIPIEPLQGKGVFDFLIPASELKYELSLMQDEEINIQFPESEDRVTITNDKNDRHVFMTEIIDHMPVYPEFEQNYNDMPVQSLDNVLAELKKYVSPSDPEQAYEGIYFNDGNALALNRNYGAITKGIHTDFINDSIFNVNFHSIVKLFESDIPIGIGKDDSFNKMLFKQVTDNLTYYYAVTLINRDYPYDKVQNLLKNVVGNYEFSMFIEKSDLNRVLKQIKGYSKTAENDMVDITYDGQSVIFEKQGQVSGGRVELPVLEISEAPFKIKTKISALTSLVSTITDSTFEINFNTASNVMLAETIIEPDVETLVFISFNRE